MGTPAQCDLMPILETSIQWQSHTSCWEGAGCSHPAPSTAQGTQEKSTLCPKAPVLGCRDWSQQ